MSALAAGKGRSSMLLDVVDAQPLHDGLREHAAGEGPAEDVLELLVQPPDAELLNEKSFVLNSCELTEEDLVRDLDRRGVRRLNKNVVSGS